MSAVSPTRSAVLSVYRTVLRTNRTVFQGDTATQQRTRAFVRQHFEQHRHESDQGKISELIATARDGARYLRDHVVQIVKDADAPAAKLVVRPELMRDPKLVKTTIEFPGKKCSS